jgi:hypothetical protein
VSANVTLKHDLNHELLSNVRDKGEECVIMRQELDVCDSMRQ